MSKFQGLFIGRSVRVKSLTINDWQQWVVMDIRSIYTEDGEVMNPVTLLTLDRDGVPHIITLPALLLIY
jgi:hypothetical protein